MDSGGGTKVANNLITTEDGFVLDARQGKILNDYIAQVNDDLLKMIQASGVITGDDDWNKYINAGVYKVQDANMTAENHAPVGMRRWGILIVPVSETDGELRRVHIYFPNVDTRNNVAPSTAPIIAIRQYNHLIGQDYTDADWQSWYAIQGTLLQ